VFLAGMFLFVPSDTFAVGCIVRHKMHYKNEWKKHVRLLVYVDYFTRVA